MIKWFTKQIMYKPLKRKLDRKLIELGGFRGEANTLYGFMWMLVKAGYFTEAQAEDLRKAVPCRGPKNPAVKVKVRRVN